MNGYLFSSRMRCVKELVTNVINKWSNRTAGYLKAEEHKAIASGHSLTNWAIQPCPGGMSKFLKDDYLIR